jgi:hypothetical protein
MSALNDHHDYTIARRTIQGCMSGSGALRPSFPPAVVMDWDGTILQLEVANFNFGRRGLAERASGPGCVDPLTWRPLLT